MEPKQEISFLRAIGNGTVMYFKNLHIVLLVLLPYLAGMGLWAYKMFANGTTVDPLKMINASFYIYMMLGGLFMAWAINYATLVIASKPDVLGLTIENKALTALKRLPGLLVVYMMYGIGAMFGMLLLIVPGFIALTVWSLVTFVYTLNGGIIRSFEEGRELIRGSAWKMFFLFAILIAAAVGLMFVIMGNLSLFTGLKGTFVSVLFWIPYTIIYFWLLAIYKEIKEKKNFTHDTNRKGTNGFYKFLSVASVILACGMFALHAFTFLSWMPKVYKDQGMEIKVEGAKTVTYRKGIPISATENKENGIITNTSYYENGAINTEFSMKGFQIVNSKAYYKSGELKSDTTYSKGKMPGETVYYDKKGRVVNEPTAEDAVKK